MDRLVVLPEILGRYASVLPGQLPVALLGAALAGLAWHFRRWPWILLALAVPGGLALAWTQLSIVDDAFVTLRYVDNLLRGHGPVWNPGEKVEGITNFGWMLLIAGLSGTGALSIEHAALAWNLASYLALVGVVAGAERWLGGPGTPPLAAALLAVQYSVTAFASTGLESELAAALLVAGALAMTRPGERWTLVAGAAWLLAGLVRVDHMLAYVLGFAWLVARERWSPRQLLAYALPAVPVFALYAWKLWYYGDIFPNTAYVKAAGRWYGDQGLVYLAVCWLGSHLWVLAPCLVAWPALARGPERQLAAYALAFSAAWHMYLLRIGGDFMVGRFLLPVVPFALLAAARVAALLSSSPRNRRFGLALVLLMGATARGGPLVRRGGEEWYLADESTVYPVTALSPLKIDHAHFNVGHALRDVLTERGITPVIATSGIGMVGFYSGLEVIDALGLTDRTVARTGYYRRGKPGHERVALPEYLDQRRVFLMRGDPGPGQRALHRFDLPGSFRGARGVWFLRRYDETLMQQIARDAPEIRFTRFRIWVRSDLFPRLRTMDPVAAREELARLDHYYWDLNGHDALRAEFVTRIEALEAR